MKGWSNMTSLKNGFTPKTCFWCGNETKTNNANAFDYGPCPMCKKTRFRMDKGILLIGVSEKPSMKNQPRMNGIGYPTGRWAIMSENIANHFNNGDNDMRRDHIGFIEDSLLKDIMSKVKRA